VHCVLFSDIGREIFEETSNVASDDDFYFAVQRQADKNVSL